jgi:hypothetical protein
MALQMKVTRRENAIAWKDLLEDIVIPVQLGMCLLLTTLQCVQGVE